MSIAPPSDIILDVAQAADPLKLQAATTKLARAAADSPGASAPSFDAALDSAGPGVSRSTAALPLPLRTVASAPPSGGHVKQQAANQKFEAMVLQSFIENILPKNAELFGDAESADMGRSLLAEQIANQMAKSGRIGIAKSLERTTVSAPGATPLPLTPPAASRT